MSVAVRMSALLLLGALAGCAPAGRSFGRGLFHRSEKRELTRDEQVTHVLSRLTFGARAGDAERVAAMGVDRWIHDQLLPDRVADSALTLALAPLNTWALPTAELGQLGAVPLPPPLVTVSKDSTGKEIRKIVANVRALLPLTDQFFAGKIIRAQVSERQLLEVMSDFWENHFSVFVGKMPSRDALITWDRDVLRPRALGRFRDLLGAVAHNPAMLFYLDNQQSRKRAINENYARELLELHTLGVDGGYTQQDVIAVARALTGWTLSPATPGVPQLAAARTFVFNATMHDSATKVVLGHSLAAGRGIEDGDEVLDILARHPSTARFIAWKLIRRFVSDTPPPALVTRAAEAFTRTDGDIAEVVRTIVTSSEFYSRSALRAKIKTPFELVVSVRRALNTPVDTSPRTVRLLAQLGQPMFGRQSPDGWPDDGAAWMNSGTIVQRIRLGADMVTGPLGRTTLEQWPGWAPLAARPVEEQVDGVSRLLLGGTMSSNTRKVLLETSGEAPQRLRSIMALALGSPEFQRR